MYYVRKTSHITTKIFFILILLFNCSSKKDIVSKELTDIQIYNNGVFHIQEKEFEKAANEFDKLYLNYPFSSLATKAEIMTAYSLFQNNQINKAINKLEEFIDINPSGELSEYAQYLLAMSYYIQVSNEGRDPNLSQEALKYFQIIVTKYPKSVYSKDAKLKIEYINNSLAQNELMIGIFYLNNNLPASSINRFKSIIENRQNTSVIPETLYRLCEAFLMLGLKQEAVKSSSLLNYNFPENEWTKLSNEILMDSKKTKKNKSFLKSITNYMKKMID
ncbi:outer membrane protein assembly factor BamD [Alphaproteobacteria bacterium]|nr:outer membrane protein assembly factor BamD [Alphaproteobacteria bacterium]